MTELVTNTLALNGQNNSLKVSKCHFSHFIHQYM